MDEAGDSFGRASVLLHPEANIAIGRTAASRRYVEYGFMGALNALEALKALVVMESTFAGSPARPETCGQGRWYYWLTRLV